MADKYGTEIQASEVPRGVRFDVTRRDQGQMVEYAYGGFSRGEHGEGDPYQRVTDRSTGRVQYYRHDGAHATYGWGVFVDRWHDEGRVAHLLRGDNSPVCGAIYYTATRYTATRRDPGGLYKCKRCERIEKNLRKDNVRIA